MSRAAFLLQAASLALLIGGGLLWGVVGLLKFNPLDLILSRLTPALLRGLYILVGLAALYHVTRRDTYLPFLGPAAFPCGALKEVAPDGADVVMTVPTSHPHATVVYWAAEPSPSASASPTKAPEPVKSPYEAYALHKNAGVARTDANGMAVFKVRRPAAYKVGLMGSVQLPHIHYRLCDGQGGLLDRIETVPISPAK